MAIDTQERMALADALRRAAAEGPRGHLDDSGNPGRDQRLWKVLTDHMGLSSLFVEDEEGQHSGGIAEMAVILEELTRSLAVVPALSSLGIASSFLRVLDTAEARGILSRLAAAGSAAAVCWPNAASATAIPTIGCTAVGDGRVTIDGRVEFVLDGVEADILLVPALCGEQAVVVALEVPATGLRRRPMTGLDLTRGLAEIEFAECPACVIASGVDLQPALDMALVLIAAEQVAIAQKCHDQAVAWAKQRIQFDRPIGQFQAIKHHLVNLLMDVELGRSALDVAVSAADDYLAGPSPQSAHSLAVAASVAKARCGEAAVVVADESLHILGGIGFTWEHDAHLYFRRAKALEVLFGTPAVHRRRFATILLAEANG